MACSSKKQIYNQRELNGSFFVFTLLTALRYVATLLLNQVTKRFEWQSRNASVSSVKQSSTVALTLNTAQRNVNRKHGEIRIKSNE